MSVGLRPRVMNFFFDRNIAPRLAKMVAAYEGDRHNVCHHDERFDPETKDADWIRTLGQEKAGWVVISGDAAILRNKAEKAVLREANLSFFCMPKQWFTMSFHDQAWKFIRVWPQIVSSADTKPPRIFDLQMGANPKVIMGLPTRS